MLCISNLTDGLVFTGTTPRTNSYISQIGASIYVEYSYGKHTILNIKTLITYACYIVL